MKPKRSLLIGFAIALCLGFPGQAAQNLFLAPPAAAPKYISQAPFPHFANKLVYKFPDGTVIKVHFDAQDIQKTGASPYFGQDVLNAAVEGYQTITQFQGFSSAGYTFANPDKKFAYDPDKTIDIFIGDPQAVPPKNAPWMTFKDAPCFDTVRRSDTAYDAVILVPLNYKDFIRNWEKINPSPLGKRNLEVDLRGTLIHEMLHVIVFYYNHNLNHEEHAMHESSPRRHVDWYVEGLARYFETFAGARHDFYSQGFKQTLADRIRFSRGGANYFMRYPDQPFTDLRYENALFWRFMDTRYGMASIERLTRLFRGQSSQDFRQALEDATGASFEELLKQFSLAVLLKDFGLKEDTQYLKDIAKTHLLYKENAFWLLDGNGAEKYLGRKCQTDWVGSWDGVKVSHGEASAGGDSTSESEVSGWATDFYQIDVAGGQSALPDIAVHQNKKEGMLVTQVLVESKGGSLIGLDVPPEAVSAGKPLPLNDYIRNQGLLAGDINKIYLLITNIDPAQTAHYEIIV